MDALLTINPMLEAVTDHLGTLLPAAAVAFHQQSPAMARLPFCVVAQAPSTVEALTLSRRPDLLILRFRVFSMHESEPQASALADVVRDALVGTVGGGGWAWPIPLTGAIVLHRSCDLDGTPVTIQGIAQVNEGYELQVQRT